MSVFAVIGSVNSEAIGAAVVKQYGANHYRFTTNVWLVPDSGTSKDVSEKLGLTNGGLNAQGVVLRFEGYSGFAAADGWKWLATQSGVISNG